jgi:hypothetical protein
VTLIVDFKSVSRKWVGTFLDVLLADEIDDDDYDDVVTAFEKRQTRMVP